MPSFRTSTGRKQIEIRGNSLNLTSAPPHVFQEEDIKMNLQEEGKKVTNKDPRSEISIADQLLNCKDENERLRAIILKQSAQMTVATNFAKIEDEKIIDVDKILDHYNVTHPMRRTIIKMQLRPNQKKQSSYSQEERLLAIL